MVNKLRLFFLKTATVSAISFLLLLPIQIELSTFQAGWLKAFAEEGHDSSHSGGHSGGKRGGGGHHDSGDDSSHDDHDSHAGKRGHKKSGRNPAEAVEGDVLKGHGRSRRPVWAGGGIPHVELGRLNVSRAPSHVLDRALAMAQAELAQNPDTDIHSPLANLAMYREIIKAEAVNQQQIEMAARYLGIAADMNTPLSSDSVEALNIIMGIGLNLNNEQVSALALQADSIRAERLAAHGDEGHTDDGHH